MPHDATAPASSFSPADVLTPSATGQTPALTSVYHYIGQRIKHRRKMLKMNQKQLAELVGVSYQQMQKYENGSSQISVSRLLAFAHLLAVPPHYFYEGAVGDDLIGSAAAGIIQKSRTQPLQVLLVEHNPADVLAFKKALSAAGEDADVDIISDADKLLPCLHNYAATRGRKLPDLLVMDLAQPRAGGLELLRRIKKHPHTLELPVVVLTHSISMSDMIEAYRLGAAGFIQKAVDAAEYAESVGALVKYWAKTVALPCQRA